MSYRIGVASSLITAMTVLGVLAGPAVAAEEKKQGMLHSRFQVRGGGFFAVNIDSSVEYSTQKLPGSEVDFESDLGLDDSEIMPFASFLFRFNPRHAVSGDWLPSNRDGTKKISFDLDIEGETFPVGASLKTSFDFDLFRVGYEYSFVHNDKLEVALSVGGHFMDFDIKIRDQTFGTDTFEQNVTGFYPNIGAVVRAQLAPKVATQGRIQWLSFNDIDKYNGSLLLAEIAIEHQTTKHLGFGAGFRYFNFSFGRDGNSTDWEYRFRDVGPAVYALLTF